MSEEERKRQSRRRRTKRLNAAVQKERDRGCGEERVCDGGATQ
jgi:hypothetical protein